MPNYDAGAAVGKYILDTTAAERSLAAMAKRLQDFEALQKRVLSGGGGSGGAVSAEEVKIQQALARRAAAEARLAAEANKRLLIDQRIAQSGAQTALAEQRRQTELAKTANEEAKAARSALQLEQARVRASRQNQNGGLGPALPRTFAGVTEEGSAAIRSELLGIVGPAALATAAISGLGAAVQGVGSAARDSLNLQQITAGLRTASGSAQTYADALDIARQNQILYGASAAEAQAALIGLANISRTTGVELSSIDEVVRQLRASDPAATFEDASIALREFLSGDITSLAERFELPRASLRALADESVPAEEKIRRLNAMLLESGFSADTAASAVPKATREINQLGVDADRVRIAVGGLAAELAGLAAGGANDGGGLTKFADNVEQGGAIVTDALRRIGDGASPLDAFRAAVRASAEEMLGISGAADAAGKSTDELAAGTLRAGEASAQQAVQSEIARAQSELQAITLRDLQAAAQAAADGSGSIEQAAAALAAQFPVTAEEAAKLIGLLRELADAGNEADRSSGVALRNAENQYRLGRQNEDPAARALREQEERLAGAAAGLAQRRAAEERARVASRGGGKGISAIDKDTIDAASTLQGELEAVNALLERGNLTVHQRNDLLEKQRDLQEKIADLTLDTALAAARDQQKRIEENRTLAQNKAIIEGAQFSAEQKAAAQAETNVILLEQQKRQRDIARDAADAGIAPAGAALPAVPGAPTALPNLPAVPNLPQFALPTAAALVPPQINVNLAVNIQDKQVTSVQADPGVIVRALVNGGALAGAATGAMP